MESDPIYLKILVDLYDTWLVIRIGIGTIILFLKINPLYNESHALNLIINFVIY